MSDKTVTALWIKKYNGIADDLKCTQEQAGGFLAGFNDIPDVNPVIKGNAQVTVSLFLESQQAMAAVDQAHLLYYSGHGSPEGLLLSAEGGILVAPGTEGVRWGNGSLLWVILDACEVLSSGGVKGRWRKTFAGLHQVLGFQSKSSDEPDRGSIFAANLLDGWPVQDAWEAACEESEDSDKTRWAWLRADSEGTDTSSDGWSSADADPTAPLTLTYHSGSC